MDLQKINKSDILANVKVENEMFSLTDLWKLAGSPKNKRPIDWQKMDSTIELIEAMAIMNQSGLKPLLKSKRGGNNAGTYGHKSIALSYAKYLDAKIHILVNEVFFERIEEEKNPDLIVDRAIRTYERRGMKPEWVTKRLTAKGVRNEFTHLLKEHGVSGTGYKDCTDAMYIGLYGKTAKKIREVKNLPEKTNIRDNMSLLELQAISFAETLAMDDIETNRKYGNEECKISSNLAARTVSQSIINFRNKK